MAQREFTVYRTHHGPIVREVDGKWVSVRLMEEPVKALTQSYTRTKAKNFAEFKEIMDLHTNSSNNTVFADADGNIAYFHANFIPKRDPKFDWTKPVDGSDPATEWQGVHSVDEAPNVLQPEERLALQHEQLAVDAPPARTARSRRTIPRYVERNTREPARRPRHPRAEQEEGLHARHASWPPPSTASCRRSSCSSRRCSRPTTSCRRRAR